MRKAEKTGNELFDIFWSAYPRKEGKPKSIRWFEKNKVDSETLEKMLKELERQSKAKNWKRIDMKYIPMPLTWLNRRDWEVERSEPDNSNSDCSTGTQYGAFVL